MNWNDIRFILAIAEFGKLQEAAEAMKVSHTTVWRRIQALEKGIGAQLFVSDRQGYRLTDIGEQVIRHAKNVSDSMDAIDEIVSGQKTELKGLIRITVPLQAANTFLPSVLKEFRTLYPQIQFEVIQSNVQLDLERREADIAIRGTNKAPDNLVGRCLGRTNWSLFVHDEYYEGRLMSLEEIKRLPLIGYQTASTPSLRWYDSAFQECPKAILCNGIDEGQGFAEAGLGVALLPTNGDNALNEIYTLPERFGVELWLLTHKEMRNSAKIRAFWEFLLAKLEQHELLRKAMAKRIE
ncbi:LysR family transcriptional regulator [Reinekea marina]|uniref:LysR family transcriptional regulator n=1 Tax=Reinekea marina TaxID=1310421 RepID=A0ABV7WMY3_9GAMM|nr:LysR family transcriptional regulator [Reinekea marina]MDN3648674.1 LysR family transcriptional regulator [Reinekea marina]